MAPPPEDHDCGWRVYALSVEAKNAEMTAKMAEVKAKMEALERRLFGKRSEKMPPALPRKKGPRSATVVVVV